MGAIAIYAIPMFSTKPEPLIGEKRFVITFSGFSNDRDERGFGS